MELREMLKKLETETIINKAKQKTPCIFNPGVNVYLQAACIDEIRTEELIEILKEEGVKPDLRRKSSKGTVNDYYVGKNIVLITIKAAGDGKDGWTIIDRELFDKTFKDSKCSFIFTVRHDRAFKVIINGTSTSGEKYKNAPLHQIACSGFTRGSQVDHVSHSTYLNTSEYLRVCDNESNSMNRRFYSKVDNKKLRFTAVNKITNMSEKLLWVEKGYKFFKRGGTEYIRSKEFKSRESLFIELNKYEEKYLGAFRYNPLLDFEETWYALVIAEFIGGLSQLDIMEYNRDYIIRTDHKSAEYYRLAE